MPAPAADRNGHLEAGEHRDRFGQVLHELFAAAKLDQLAATAIGTR